MRPPVQQPRRPVRTAARPLAGILVAVLVGAGLSSCSSGSSSGAGLPTIAGSCSSSKSHAAPETVPVSVLRSGAGAIAEAAVCIGGHGPYAFAVASGAGQSVVAPSVARALHLPGSAGTTAAMRGVTCSATAPETALSAWSIGGLPLATQTVAVSDVPSLGISPAPLGLIGSDVLARFGAFRLDYQGHKLVLATAEEPAATQNIFILGQSSTPPPAALVHSAHPSGTTLSVLESPAGTLVTAQATFGKHKEQLAVDTGSLGSSMSAATAQALSLAGTGKQGAVSGPGCKGSAPLHSSGAWALGTVNLPETSLVEQTFAGTANQQIVGAVGSDVLRTFSSVVIDYHGAHLWLGAG